MFNKICFSISYAHGNREFTCIADARATCISRGGELVSIVSMTEKNWLNNRLKALSGWAYSFWLGLNSRDFPLQFYWSDRSPYKLTAWDSGYPTNTPKSKCYKDFHLYSDSVEQTALLVKVGSFGHSPPR